MRNYALRYLPLLLLALLLLPFRNSQQNHYLITGSNNITVSEQQLLPSPFTPGTALYGLAIAAPEDIWAAGGTFQITSTAHENIDRVVPGSGLIMHLQNGSWLASAELAEPLLSISMSSTQDGWAVGYAGFLTHYNGQSWQTMQTPTNAILCSVVMLSAQDGWAVGFGGTILHFHNQQWSIVPAPTNADLLSIKMLSAQDGWIVGRNGTTLHYTHGHWQIVPVPTTQTLNDISFLSPDEGWIVGNQGTILHYRDGIWTHVQWLPGTKTSSQNTILSGIVMTTQETGWIVGQQAILAYQQEVWQQTQSDTKRMWYALAMASPNDGWAVGNDNSIYHYQGGIWRIVYDN